VEIDMTYDFVEHKFAPSDRPKCFALSVHKSGSTLMHNMIKQVCIKSKIPFCDIPVPMFNKGIADHIWNNDPSLRMLIKDGYIYLGFRRLPVILTTEINESATKSVLLVRDPRDALVSQYFSFKPGGSHAVPKENSEKFVTKKLNQKDLTIDEYVLKKAALLLTKLTEYKDNLNFSNLKLFKYEDIFFDKYIFLKAIFEHFNIAVEDVILQDVAKKNDIVPKKEDTSKHIRKGTPGDYKDKLTQDTIEKLNFQFNDVALFYGYDLLS
jgi:hypothetical protein